MNDYYFLKECISPESFRRSKENISENINLSIDNIEIVKIANKTIEFPNINDNSIQKEQNKEHRSTLEIPELNKADTQENLVHNLSNINENENIIEETKIEKKFSGFTRKDLLKLKKEDLYIYDKRTFSEYLLDLIKTGHSVVSLFCFKSLMEPLSIRISFFFFSLSLNFVFNALFYSDEYIQSTFSANDGLNDVK
jgi:hypothetical protein